MTFEEWFNMQIDLDDCEVVRIEEVFSIAKAAWEASRENLRTWDL